jgi:proline iminopeptidase
MGAGKWGPLLRFFRPLLPLLLAAAAQAAASEREGFVNVQGGPVWYHVAGDGSGRPLLMLHGGPGGTSCGFSLLAALGVERPLIRYDQLGTGRSGRPNDPSLWTIDGYVERLHALRQQLALEDFHLLGHSWGAALAAAYLLEKGTSGVISVTFSSPLLNTDDWMADANLLRSQLPSEVRGVLDEHEQAGTTDSEPYRKAAGIFYERHVYGGPKPESPAACSGAPWNPEIYQHMWGPTEFRATGNLLGLDLASQLHRLDLPALFLTGEYDEARPETVRRFSRQMNDASFVEIADAAHATLVRQPEQYMAVLETFLDQAEAAAISCSAADSCPRLETPQQDHSP